MKFHNPLSVRVVHDLGKYALAVDPGAVVDVPEMWAPFLALVGSALRPGSLPGAEVVDTAPQTETPMAAQEASAEEQAPEAEPAAEEPAEPTLASFPASDDLTPGQKKAAERAAARRK